MEGQCKYSCNTATATFEWIEAIVNFLRPCRFLFEAHVVNFFKDQLWEYVDQEWLECLCNDPIERLIEIPSGLVMDQWPASLKEFILTSKSLVFPREQVKLEEMLAGIHLRPLNNTVLAQGMNGKKKHEVEVLAAVVSSIVASAAADIVVDVGAGQGYLAQVLSFQYQLPVVAIDASYHHGMVTKARAERIKKHYEAKMRKSAAAMGGERLRPLNMPKTVTCRVLSSITLRNLAANLGSKNINDPENHPTSMEVKCPCPEYGREERCDLEKYLRFPSVVLAGLHACGDLSSTMLRAFVECEDVRGVVSVGCCYNLLSEEVEEGCQNGDTYNSDCGFPMSRGVKLMGLTLGRNARDLACQSAERWRNLQEEDGLQNFDLHAFRALFQILLHRYYPQVVLSTSSTPSIGRQGKALRRQEQRRKQQQLHSSTVLNPEETRRKSKTKILENDSCDRFHLFEKFCKSGLSRLRLQPMEDIDLHGIWKEYYEQFGKTIGPYWSLRAALGPLLETLVLLDRMLFIQEHCSSDVLLHIVPIFDPLLSPRNLAIIARKI
ncbi:hypothetical protein Dimus_019313 [Dionaea muscipula]